MAAPNARSTWSLWRGSAFSLADGLMIKHGMTPFLVFKHDVLAWLHDFKPYKDMRYETNKIFQMLYVKHSHGITFLKPFGPNIRTSCFCNKTQRVCRYPSEPSEMRNRSVWEGLMNWIAIASYCWIYTRTVKMTIKRQVVLSIKLNPQSETNKPKRSHLFVNQPKINNSSR